MVCSQAEALIENVGYPDYIVDVQYMANKYKEVCFDCWVHHCFKMEHPPHLSLVSFRRLKLSLVLFL